MVIQNIILLKGIVLMIFLRKIVFAVIVICCMNLRGMDILRTCIPSENLAVTVYSHPECLYCCAFRGDIEGMKKAVINTPIDAPDNQRKTALCYAVLGKQAEAIRCLRSLGASRRHLYANSFIKKLLRKSEYRELSGVLKEHIAIGAFGGDQKVQEVVIQGQLDQVNGQPKAALQPEPAPESQQGHISMQLLPIKQIVAAQVPRQKLQDQHLYKELIGYLNAMHLQSAFTVSCFLEKLEKNDFVDQKNKERELYQIFENVLLLGSKPWLANLKPDERETHVSQVCALISLLLVHNKDLLFGIDALGGQALHRAVSQGTPAIVEHLLKEGAMESIEIPDKTQRTPLARAVAYEKMDVAKLLLKAGASPATCKHVLEALPSGKAQECCAELGI